MKFIFRGDLDSNNGYSRAIRAYANLCRNFGEIGGVAIHRGEVPRHLWRDPLYEDAELFANGSEGFDEPVFVIQICTPDLFIRYPGAVNVGCFFWESHTLPLTFDWVSGFNSIDWLWLPVSYMEEMPLVANFPNKLLLPWPLMFSDEGQSGNKEKYRGLSLYLTEWTKTGEKRTKTLEEVRQKFDNVFISVSSIAARKGVAGLLKAWIAADIDGALIVRLSLKHYSFGMTCLRDYLCEIGLGEDELKGVFFLLEEISEVSLNKLYEMADFYVTNTFGEGFGGPVAEAIQHGVPVIAPIHTGIKDLLPEDHQLKVRHEVAQINLCGNLDVYPPATEWCIPDFGDMIEVLKNAENTDKESRNQIASAQFIHFAQKNNRKYLLETLGQWVNEV